MDVLLGKKSVKNPEGFPLGTIAVAMDIVFIGVYMFVILLEFRLKQHLSLSKQDSKTDR